MSSIGAVSSMNAVSVLTGPGGPLASFSSSSSESLLASASASDLANLSTESLALSNVNALYGGSTSSSSPTTDWSQSIVEAAYGVQASAQSASSASISSSADVTSLLLSAAYGTAASQYSSNAAAASQTSGSMVNVMG